VSNHSSLPGSALRVKRKEKSNGLLPLYKLFELKNPHYFLSLFPTKNKKTVTQNSRKSFHPLKQRKFHHQGNDKGEKFLQ
jgi:hypothetical protein